MVPHPEVQAYAPGNKESCPLVLSSACESLAAWASTQINFATSRSLRSSSIDIGSRMPLFAGRGRDLHRGCDHGAPRSYGGARNLCVAESAPPIQPG